MPMKPSNKTTSSKRRRILQSAVGITFLHGAPKQMLASAQAAVSGAFTRVRPGDPGWPSEAHWNELSQQVGNALVKVQSPLVACLNAPVTTAGNYSGSSITPIFSATRWV
ncbi:hypothetical protein OKW45_004266 [Paraburkholderia sp. WSM4175]|uniref:hypothetical protein n=1 Tax=Paraburkholderia sp. WSM4175 TaxID=2991072 RepID=UPI003D23F6B6